VGAGLVGSLLAILLARRGHRVDVYERRPDLRKADISAGRSINLALSDRGLRALERAGVAARVQQVAIPMRGRALHQPDGSTGFLPYGRDDQWINSVSRGGLNGTLLDLAEEHDGVRLFFQRRCVGADLRRGVARVEHDGAVVDVEGDAIFGADGAFSALRYEMQKLDRFQYAQDFLDYGYKELTIPPGPGGSFLLEKNALHIWPRGQFMLIALPNVDGSFTCTLFLPYDGDKSFARMTTAADARAFFAAEFGDALALMPTFDDDVARNPVGSLPTIRCRPWTHAGRFCLIGDAAHAIVPFFGQGMNAGFEDCTVLDDLLARHGDDFARALPAFEASRKPNADAIAALALENFVEMRDKVADPVFLLRKKIEAKLGALRPDRFVPKYTMVTFSSMPYAEALARGAKQDRALDEILALPDIARTWNDDDTVPVLTSIVDRCID
jgi:kynurenine 3-monooxygenase